MLGRERLRGHHSVVTLALVGCGVAYLAGVLILFATRHEAGRPPTKPVRYFIPGRFSPLPFVTEPRPIPERSWKWQLGLGLVLYAPLIGGVLLVVKLMSYLASSDKS